MGVAGGAHRAVAPLLGAHPALLPHQTCRTSVEDGVARCGHHGAVSQPGIPPLLESTGQVRYRLSDSCGSTTWRMCLRFSRGSRKCLSHPRVSEVVARSARSGKVLSPIQGESRGGVEWNRRIRKMLAEPRLRRLRAEADVGAEPRAVDGVRTLSRCAASRSDGLFWRYPASYPAGVRSLRAGRASSRRRRRARRQPSAGRRSPSRPDTSNGVPPPGQEPHARPRRTTETPGGRTASLTVPRQPGR